MFIFRICGFHALPPEMRTTLLIFNMPNVSSLKARYGRLLEYCSPIRSLPYVEAGFDSLIITQSSVQSPYLPSSSPTYHIPLSFWDTLSHQTIQVKSSTDVIEGS